MREGRTPLLEAVRQAYPPYLLARKAYNRKHEEVREQLGLLNATVSGSIKKLRELSRNTQDSGEGMITLYEMLSKQTKEVSTFIEAVFFLSHRRPVFSWLPPFPPPSVECGRRLFIHLPHCFNQQH